VGDAWKSAPLRRGEVRSEKTKNSAGGGFRSGSAGVAIASAGCPHMPGVPHKRTPRGPAEYGPSRGAKRRRSQKGLRQ
jgi:hypothetical protein